MRLNKCVVVCVMLVVMSVFGMVAVCSGQETTDESNPVNTGVQEVRVDLTYGVGRKNDGYIFGVTAFNTIQSAVNAVQPGGRIVVQRGTYVESIRIDKPVQIIALDGQENTIIQSDGNDEVVIRVRGTSSLMGGLVVIDGFTIEGGVRAEDVKTALLFEGANGLIRNSTIQKIRKKHQNSSAIAITQGSSVTVQDCVVQDYWKIGIYVGDPNTYGTIVGSRILGEIPSDPSRVQRGIYVGYGANATISFCEISHHDNFASSPQALSHGVYIMEWPEGYPGATGTRVTIANSNIFDNMVGVQVGYVYDEDRSTVTLQQNRFESNRIGVLATSRGTVLIQNNYFSGRSPNNEYAILVKQPFDVHGPFHAPSVELRYNRFNDYNTAICIEDVTTDPKSVTLRANMNYFGNCANAAIDGAKATRLIDATNNWWGTSDGPSVGDEGKGNKIIGNVLYDPWLENNVFEQLVIGY